MTVDTRLNGGRAARTWTANVRVMQALAGLQELADELRSEVSRRALENGAAYDDEPGTYGRWLVAVAQHVGAVCMQLRDIQSAMAQGVYEPGEVRRVPRCLLGTPPRQVLAQAEGISTSIVQRVNALHWGIAQVTHQPIRRGAR